MKGLKVFFAFALVVAAILGGGMVWAKHEASSLVLPPIEIGKDSIVYASDGSELGSISATDEDFAPLSDDDISALLRHAHMAAEDRRFYQHDGVSLQGIAFAMLTNIINLSLSAGGSTITQQYVKNAYLSQVQTFERKIKEVSYSYRAEQDFTKDQILTNYLNSNYYGRGAYGIEAASQVWFGHSATEISDFDDPLQVAKAAFLATLIKQPSYYDEAPSSNPSQLTHLQEVIDRQIYVLDGLRDLQGVDGMVAADVVEEAKQLLPLELTDNTQRSGRSSQIDPYILAYIKQWLQAWQTELAKQDGLQGEEAERQGESMAEAMLARGGLKFHISIDPGLQNALADAVELPDSELSAGVVILNPQTGGIAAMYGGINYAADSYNYALYADRQVGSVMKTVVLADAVRNGISVQSEFAAPAHIEIEGSKIWNHDREAAPNCKLTLADAMAASNNPVHIELISGKMASCDNPADLSNIEMEDGDYPVSPASVAALAREMGSDDSLVPGRISESTLDEVPSLAIGVNSLTPLKLGVIGATLANSGVHTRPYFVQRIESGDDTLVYEHEAQSSRVLEEEHAHLVNQVLTGVYTYGTASGAQVSGHPLAGKTGTTETDARMLAFPAADPDGNRPAYVCSAWAGYADGERSIDGVIGSFALAQICQRFYQVALQGTPTIEFPGANMEAGQLIGLNANRPDPTPTLAPPTEVVVDPPSPSPEPAPSPTIAPTPTAEPSIAPTPSEVTPTPGNE
jgi:membrane peptidoglycan carboxypeptidase